MKLIAVEPENLDLAWRDVVRFIEDGLKYSDGKYSVGDIHKLLVSGLLVLWVVYNEDVRKATGCLLTEVLKYPRTQVLSIFILSGEDFNGIVTLLDDLKDYAKGVHCESIEFLGRPGWEKRLKEFKFEKIHTVMRLKL